MTRQDRIFAYNESTARPSGSRKLQVQHGFELNDNMMHNYVQQRRRNVSDLAYKVRRSWLFHYVVIFLHEKEIVRLQLLERYFYDV